MAVPETAHTADDGVPTPFESAALLMSGTGPSTVLLLRGLVEAVRQRYVGRETTLRSGGNEVTLVPTAVGASGVGPRALTAGKLDDVRISARDIEQEGLQLRELTVAAADVRLRPGFAPELVTGPIEIEAVLDPAWIAARLHEHAPNLLATIDADGVPRARLRNRPRLGAADLEVTVSGHTLYWRVTALTVARRRIPLPHAHELRRPFRGLVERSALRAFRSGQVELPNLPDALELHDIDILPGRIAVRGRMGSWRKQIPRARIDDVLRGARALLDLGR